MSLKEHGIPSGNVVDNSNQHSGKTGQSPQLESREEELKPLLLNKNQDVAAVARLRDLPPSGDGSYG